MNKLVFLSNGMLYGNGNKQTPLTNNINELHNCNMRGKKLHRYNSIHLKFKNMQVESIVLEAKIVNFGHN